MKQPEQYLQREGMGYEVGLRYTGKAYDPIEMFNRDQEQQSSKAAALRDDQIHRAMQDIESELRRAKSKYPADFNSSHEGYAVLLEEVDEMWDEVKAKHFDKVKGRQEAVQIAAMAIRFITELCD